MTWRIALTGALVAALWLPVVAVAHDAPRDGNGGHECTQADVSAGKCEPAGSYHCHVQTCVQPSDKPPTTSGGPTLADLEAAQGGTGTGTATASATATAGAPATVAPATTAPTPVATTRALGTTGGFTDVLGWIAIAVLFLGFALVLFTGRDRPSTPGPS